MKIERCAQRSECILRSLLRLFNFQLFSYFTMAGAVANDFKTDNQEVNQKIACAKKLILEQKAKIASRIGSLETKYWAFESIIDIVIHETYVCSVSYDRVFFDESKNSRHL